MTTNRALKVDGKTVYVGEIAGPDGSVTRFVLANTPRQAVNLLRKEISYSREYGVTVGRPKVLESDNNPTI